MRDLGAATPSHYSNQLMESLMELTQSYLKSVLHYCPDTGVFTRLAGQGARCGSIAGSLKRGYYRMMIKGRVYTLHRLAFLYMTGDWPKQGVDHINGNPLDNRWENLRDVSQSENMRNASRSKRNASGVVGVAWDKEARKWRASIYHGKTIHLGRHDDFFEAGCARKSAEVAHGFHPNHGKR